MKPNLIFALFFIFTALKADPFSFEELPPQWEELFTQLSSPATIESEFEEVRTNSFHRAKRTFTGNLIWNSSRGLKLHYTSPAEVLIELSDSEIKMTRKGETETLSTDNENGEYFKSLLALFAWDLAYLNTHFQAQGDFESDESWSFTLIPTSKELKSRLSKIHLTGNQEVIDNIILDLKAGKKTAISLSNTSYQKSSSAEAHKD